MRARIIRPTGANPSQPNLLPAPAPASSGLALQQVSIQNGGIEFDPAIPNQGHGRWIDRHAAKLIPVAPKFERADFQQIAKEYAPFQSIVETQPQTVIAFRPKLGQFTHIYLRSTQT